MPTRRNSKLDPGDGRRRRRYSKQSNPTGVIIVLGVIAVLLLIVLTLAKRFGEETADTADDPATVVEDGESGKPTARDPSSESNDEPRTRNRPAPELTADVIIAADAVFRDAKILHATALRAKDDGDSDEYTRLIRDCRVKFKRLDSLLSEYTSWLAEATQKNWELTTIYVILGRRVKKYERLEVQLPSGDSNPR